MGRPIKHGATDQSTIIRIVDATDGTPETAVTAATSGLALKYRREGGSVVDITDSDLAAVNSSHSDGGIKHIGAGYYRLDLPDAACASGADGVLVFGLCTGMVVIADYHPLVENVEADTYARLGAPAGASIAADIATVDTVADAVKAKTDSLTFGVSGKVDANVTHVNEVEVGGSGSEGNPWGPA